MICALSLSLSSPLSPLQLYVRWGGWLPIRLTFVWNRGREGESLRARKFAHVAKWNPMARKLHSSVAHLGRHCGEARHQPLENHFRGPAVLGSQSRMPREF